MKKRTFLSTVMASVSAWFLAPFAKVGKAATRKPIPNIHPGIHETLTKAFPRSQEYLGISEVLLGDIKNLPLLVEKYHSRIGDRFHRIGLIERIEFSNEYTRHADPRQEIGTFYFYGRKFTSEEIADNTEQWNKERDEMWTEVFAQKSEDHPYLHWPSRRSV